MHLFWDEYDERVVNALQVDASCEEILYQCIKIRCHNILVEFHKICVETI